VPLYSHSKIIVLMKVYSTLLVTNNSDGIE